MTRPSVPETLTEAQLRGGYSVVIVGSYRTQSNTRAIPYAEVYRGRSSIMETPAQHIQRVAEEEKRRKVVHQPS